MRILVAGVLLAGVRRPDRIALIESALKCSSGHFV